MSTIWIYQRKSKKMEFGCQTEKLKEPPEVHDYRIPITPAKSTPARLQKVYAKRCLEGNSGISFLGQIYEQEAKKMEFGSQIEKLKKPPEVHDYRIPVTPAKSTPARLQKVYAKRCLKGNSGISFLAQIYEQEAKKMEFGSQIEKLKEPPEVHGYRIPVTPAKSTPARLQKVYARRCLKGNSAQIYEQEACDRISPDKNKEEKEQQISHLIYDREDVGIASCGSKDSEYSGSCLLEAALAAELVTKVQRGGPACFDNDNSVCSGKGEGNGGGEGDFSCQETIGSLENIKAFTDNVSRRLDFWTSEESNKVLYELNAPLDSTPSEFSTCPSGATPAFQESETTTIQGEASQESSNAAIQDAIGWKTVPSFQVSASRIDRNTVELDRENLLPERHNLLHNLDMENDNSKVESHVTWCDQEKVSKVGFISLVENEKLHFGECLEPATPMLKHNVNKRPRNLTDVNQRPLKRSKRRKHRYRPKIAGQGRSKRTVKNSPVENNEKRKHVTKTQCTVKKDKNKYVRKTGSKKKVERIILQTSTAEHCAEMIAAKSSFLSVAEQPNDDNMMEIVKPNVGGVLESVSTGCLSSDDKVMLPTVSIVFELGASHANDMKPAMQSEVGCFGGKKLSYLHLEIKPFRWSTYGIRSARDYCRNPFVRKKIGLQLWSSWVHPMPSKVNHCLSNSRKIGPNFPKRCKRKRMRRRKSIVSLISSFLHLCGCMKQFIPRGNLSSHAIIQICNQILNITNNQTGCYLKASASDPFQRLTIGEGKGEVDHERNVPENSTEIGQFLQQSFEETKGMEEDLMATPCERNSLRNCFEIGLPLRQASTNEEHGNQMIYPIEAQKLEKKVTQNCIEIRPVPIYSKSQDGSSLEHQELQLTAKSRGLPKVFNREVTVNQKDGDVSMNQISDVSDIVPHQGSDSTKKPRPKVVLDSETLRRWNQLMKIDDGAGEEKVDKEKEKMWEEERNIFRGRVDSFISRMHQVLGDRRFKLWKGSVVDSVVGVFLTQNVSDFLSSSAYMSLAAKYPVESTSIPKASVDALKDKDSQESTRRNIMSIEATQDSCGNQYFVSEPEPETPVDIVQEISLADIEDIGTTILPREYCRDESEVLICSSSACHKSFNFALMEDCQAENVVREKASSDMCSLPLQCTSQVGTKGILHIQSEMNEIQLNILNLVKSVRTALKQAADKTRKMTRGKKENVKEKENVKAKELEKIDWDSLRRIYSRPRTRDQKDSVDWESVRQAPLTEIAEVIKLRGQQTIIAKRIQDFLNRVYEYHGSIDLEWLRYAPQDLVKEYLLEIPGLGLKSVECVRLLALENNAFPVDVNVGRISVRLGWIPLESLPGDLQFHLLEEYPVMDSIQQYLWPRLSELDQRTLYELHYQMITFGKVVCTKKNPNCVACPMRAECRHLASAIASANLCLPGPSNKGEERSMVPKIPITNSALVGNNVVVINPVSVSILESNNTLESGLRTESCEPLIEEPKSPQLEQDIEDFVTGEDEEEIPGEAIIDDEEEIPTIQLNNESFKEKVNYFMDKYGPSFQTGSSSRGLVPLSVSVDSIPIRKLKQTSRLRTEHQVYEIPDNHELLRGLEKRDCDDHSPYLLAIWTAGETPDSCEPPKKRCNSQGPELCNDQTCFSCQSVREERAEIVRGTIMIPCRTAMRGRFPLNGTYFQVNEVFADHESSYCPIIVSRSLIWHLKRRIVYIGTSPSSIFRGTSSIRDIQENFLRGFICVRGWDSRTREPKPLAKRFHCPPGKMKRTGKRGNRAGIAAN